MPNPSTTTAGKNVVQNDAPAAGRAYNPRPIAAMIGPIVSGRRLPVRPTRPPDQRDNANMITGNGRNAAPAAVAL